MIRIEDKKLCCGCSSCVQCCPKQCISLTEDEEGFLYPNVDDNTCINCGLCEKVCNELHPYEKCKPQQVLAAINKNEEVRQKSSSGGIFYILAERTINEGGVVFGARFDENWQVVIDHAEDMTGVESFLGSKYVQARMANAYKDVARFLAEGRQVLFSGTPCQVAGLHKFLRKPYSNLLTLDFICHGTPSPKVWRMYLAEVIKGGLRINSVEFRNKKNGWKNFCFKLRYNEQDKTVSMLSPFQKNHYMKAFLQDITLRPSCYECKARGCSSQSDITIADFWGVNTVFPDMDDDKGTGLVFINTGRGKDALDFSLLNVKETTYESIKPLNPACYRSPQVHPKREEFFNRMESENLIDLINDCTKPTARQYARMFVSRCKSLVKRLLQTLSGGGAKSQCVDVPVTFEPRLHLLKNPRIVSVSFRCKDRGWKRYNMEIRVS